MTTSKKTIKKATSRYSYCHAYTLCAAETIYKVIILPMMLYCNNFFLYIVPSKKALFEDIQKRALKMINGQKDSVKLERARSTRNKMCALEIFNALHGLSPNAFQNYYMRVNHGHYTRPNKKNVAFPG